MDFEMPNKTVREIPEGSGVLNDQLMESIDREIYDLIEDAFQFAQNSPNPRLMNCSILYTQISQVTWGQFCEI